MLRPLTDIKDFLTAESSDLLALGAARYVVILVFYALVVGSVVFLVLNLKDERAQRSPRALWIWFTRLVVGCIWFQATLATLPFGLDNGLHALAAQVPDRAALPTLSRFATETLLPQFALFNPLVYLAEIAVATALILGLFVRIVALLGMALSILLWLGLYGAIASDPLAWPWSPLVLALLMGYLVMVAAGRALGADAWLRRSVPSVRDGRGMGRLVRWLT